MEYLPRPEAVAQQETIVSALLAQLADRRLAGKPGTRQWRFFRDCVERALSLRKESEFDNMPANQAVQFKYEVEDKLRRFYLRSGRSATAIFTLVHKSRLPDYGLSAETYPGVAGYCALVRVITPEASEEQPPAPADLKAYLERVIAEAMDAEFQAYMALPEIAVERLQQWFQEGSPAMKEILTVLTRHRQKRWVLSNPLNPSTKQLLSVKIKAVGQQEAKATTTEYWYLRWWDEKREEYVYPYRETNRQQYILNKEGENWKVKVNLRPLPRSSGPSRRR